MHRFRKSSSIKAPGGRMSWGDQLEITSPPRRKVGTAPIPENKETRKALRDMSGVTISPLWDGIVR
jgi:hypothetical protein